MASKLDGYRPFFLVAAAYDLVLGLVFFFFYGPIYQRLGIDLPNNTSYLPLIAGFVFVQGVSYWLVARNLVGNLDLVKVGALYKAIYTAVAVYYWAVGQMPHAVFGWFAVFDFLFLLGFL